MFLNSSTIYQQIHQRSLMFCLIFPKKLCISGSYHQSSIKGKSSWAYHLKIDLTTVTKHLTFPSAIKPFVQYQIEHILLQVFWRYYFLDFSIYSFTLPDIPVCKTSGFILFGYGQYMGSPPFELVHPDDTSPCPGISESSFQCLVALVG